MKPVLKRLHCPDINDIENYIPETPDNFCFLFQILVGVKEREGEESFDTIVCTPNWIVDNFKKGDVIFGYHHIVVTKYDFKAILSKIETYINEIPESTWNEIANKLSLIGKWEFQDYKE